uniref:Uncharacterized protein n=1 Tax=Oryza sativa subsp. japonica TaxID=39947 RepID=Q6Z845_ORYSJ|nr:hypothetical protein [Oryza sativa Japonica Group]BAD27644.1 hypothetical protein [Oryza sativa Japonica Group]
MELGGVYKGIRLEASLGDHALYIDLSTKQSQICGNTLRLTKQVGKHVFALGDELERWISEQKNMNEDR